MNLRYFGETDTGLQRSRNEDAFLLEGDRGLFAVADGLGGLPKGELASQLAMEGLSKRMPKQLTEENARDLCNDLSHYVRNEGMRIAGIEGIATTLTLAHVQGRQVKLAHVGDSAGFLWTRGTGKRLTQDQTIAERMRQDGVSSISEYYEHVLTQCIGQAEEIEPEFVESKLEEGDRILLCTDGLTKTLTDEEIFELLESINDPTHLAKRLVAEANDRGGPDNCTVVAIFCDS